MQTNTKAFTLVEMIVAMAVSTIIIAATYASYDLVATQYKKNIDVAEMHTSGRAIMQMIERDVRMAGFEYLDNDAKVTYGSITGPLVIKDSGDKCCDEVAVIYDYYDEDSKKVERIKITYSAGPHPRNKGGGDKYDRYRLYKQIDVLGRNNAILANPIIGSKDLLGDFVEDFQIANIIVNSSLYRGYNGGNIQIIDPTTKKTVGYISTGRTTALAFGPDGLLYRGYNGGNIQIIDPTTKKTVGYISTGRTTALAFQNKRTGQESLVTINLTLRTKNQYGKDRAFKKKDYHGGNFKIDKTDKYKRDTFSTTVL
ncbi:MAG: prepilin-type N-terminal cleavage/methylation domain-containing protein, partial [Candidatus Marinimicrobia bacterium]|nr:prepilin-type N-terminal cleavage/methylation domain-containing protein [Candidatus Neomarinimicrobiota bacterium]